jgi:hypothetical protein
LLHGKKPKPVYGYEVTERGLVIKMNEAVVVHTIFYDFVSGRNEREITRKLNGGYVPENAGKRWTAAGVRRVLLNAFYAGRASATEITHPAVIFYNVYEKTLEIFEKRAKEKAVSASGADRAKNGGKNYTSSEIRGGCAQNKNSLARAVRRPT